LNIVFDKDMINRSFAGQEEVIKPLIDKEIKEIDKVPDKELEEIQEIPIVLPQDKEVPTVVASSPTREEGSSSEALSCNCGSDSDIKNQHLMSMPPTNHPLQPSLASPR
jgi:hypothetical protein